MARNEGSGVFDSIERVHDAEEYAVDAFIAGRKALGAKLVEEYQRIQARLVELGFDAARHLREIARSRIDSWWAIGLTILNGVLAGLVLTRAQVLRDTRDSREPSVEACAATKEAGDPYWLSDWKNKTPEDRRAYFRAYMRRYRRRKSTHGPSKQRE